MWLFLSVLEYVTQKRKRVKNVRGGAQQEVYQWFRHLESCFGQWERGCNTGKKSVKVSASFVPPASELAVGIEHCVVGRVGCLSHPYSHKLPLRYFWDTYTVACHGATEWVAAWMFWDEIDWNSFPLKSLNLVTFLVDSGVPRRLYQTDSASIILVQLGRHFQMLPIVPSSLSPFIVPASPLTWPSGLPAELLTFIFKWWRILAHVLQMSYEDAYFCWHKFNS